MKEVVRDMVSVIVSAYNVENYLGSAIESLLHQDYLGPMEIVICDDCSSDHTLEVALSAARENAQVKVLSTMANSGAAFARNMCVSNSSGAYLMVHDADDLSSPSRVSALVSALDRHQDVSFVGSAISLFDDRGAYGSWSAKHAAPTKWSFLPGLPFCHPACMFRREAFLEVGGYRVAPETRRGQDYDMFMRLYAAGFRGLNLSDVLYSYRVDQDTLARRRFRYRVDESVIRLKGFRSMGLLPLGLPFVFKPYAAHLVQLARSSVYRSQLRNIGGPRGNGSLR